MFRNRAWFLGCSEESEMVAGYSTVMIACIVRISKCPLSALSYCPIWALHVRYLWNSFDSIVVSRYFIWVLSQLFGPCPLSEFTSAGPQERRSLSLLKVQLIHREMKIQEINIKKSGPFTDYLCDVYCLMQQKWPVLITCIFFSHSCIHNMYY